MMIIASDQSIVNLEWVVNHAESFAKIRLRVSILRSERLQHLSAPSLFHETHIRSLQVMMTGQILATFVQYGVFLAFSSPTQLVCRCGNRLIVRISCCQLICVSTCEPICICVRICVVVVMVSQRRRVLGHAAKSGQSGALVCAARSIYWHQFFAHKTGSFCGSHRSQPPHNICLIITSFYYHGCFFCLLLIYHVTLLRLLNIGSLVCWFGSVLMNIVGRLGRFWKLLNLKVTIFRYNVWF